MLDDPRIAEIYRQTDIRAREKRREYVESWKRGGPGVSENDARAEREAATARRAEDRRAQEERGEKEDEGCEERRKECLRWRRERGERKIRGREGPGTGNLEIPRPAKMWHFSS